MLFSRRKKNPPPVATASPLVELDREKNLILESVGGMERADGVHNLIISYQDAARRLKGFELLSRDFDADFGMDIAGDVDSLFVSRLPAVVDLDLQAGKDPQGLLNALEGCERVDDGLVDDAIMEAQDRVFRHTEGDVDWPTVPDEGLSVDRADLEAAIASAARRTFAEKAGEAGRKG